MVIILNAIVSFMAALVLHELGHFFAAGVCGVPIKQAGFGENRSAYGPIASWSARSVAGEAIDMLQAMNTGHDGSLTTIHANTPRDTSPGSRR